MGATLDPLIFTLPQPDAPSFEIRIHQEPNQETELHDTALVMWPASILLARCIAHNPAMFRVNDDNVIVELGAGCGLVGLVAASLLDCRVLLTDYNPVALQNMDKSILLNDLGENCSTVGLDFFDQEGNRDQDEEETETATDLDPSWVNMEGTKMPQANLILATDVLPYSNDSTLVANTIQAVLVPGGRAIVVSADESKRFGVEEFEDTCLALGMEVQITVHAAGARPDTSTSEEQAVHIHDMEQTAGFVEGGRLLMFIVNKPE